MFTADEMNVETAGSDPEVLTSRHYAVSFVVPAFNEERLLPATLESIRTLLDGQLAYQVVVVDNGSTDDTTKIARQNGAATFVVPGVTVGGLRNFGARHCAGDVLVFLDADVVLTKKWATNIHSTLADIREDSAVITGSSCGVPDDARWLERSWFGPWQSGRVSHMNSGHMIIARSAFERLGGFDESLQTGEDYEFSLRAQKAGLRLHGNPSLAVIHNGYPKTLGAFMRREMWHGRSDFETLGAIVRSPIALAVVAFAVLHLVALVALAAGAKLLALVSLSAVVAMCFAASLRQYRHESLGVIISNTTIYYFYLAARFAAFVSAQFGRRSFVHRESR